MKKLIYPILLLLPILAFAAPTSTIVKNLIIDGIKSSGSPCLVIDTNGLVATSTCGGGTFTTTTINGVTATTFTFATSATATGIRITTSSNTITWGITSPLVVPGTATSTFVGNGALSTIGGGLSVASDVGILFGGSLVWENSAGAADRIALDNGTATNTISVYQAGANRIDLDFSVPTDTRFFTFPDISGSFILGTSTIGSLAKWTALNTLQNAVAGTDYISPSSIPNQYWTLSGSNLYASSTSWNVGMGTTTPAVKLAIEDATNPALRIVDTGDVTLELQSVGGTRAEVGTITNHDLAFQTNNSIKMTLDASGNLGIGTTTPSHALTVSGSSVGFTMNRTGNFGAFQNFYRNGTSTWQIHGGIDSSADTFAIRSNFAGTAVNVLSIASTSRVGIGTITPASTFHVAGNVSLTGSSTIITDSIGGAPLLAGACATDTTAIDSSVSSSTAAFITTPQNFPGTGMIWQTYMSAANTITTEVCAEVAGTPTASLYVVKIIK